MVEYLPMKQKFHIHSHVMNYGPLPMRALVQIEFTQNCKNGHNEVWLGKSDSILFLIFPCLGINCACIRNKSPYLHQMIINT
jgi:hypothetical protein